MTTRLALLRHGHTSWNRAHRIQGRADVPLDAAARQQLSSLALPDAWRGAQIWSSPLARATETAILVSGKSPRVAAELVEMDWGAWEGKSGIDLLADPSSGYRNLEDWGWHYQPPGGETPGDVRARVAPWLDALTGVNVVFSHIGVMRVILAQAWGWQFRGACPFSIKRNRLYVLTRGGDTWHPEPEPTRLIEDSP